MEVRWSRRCGDPPAEGKPFGIATPDTGWQTFITPLIPSCRTAPPCRRSGLRTVVVAQQRQSGQSVRVTTIQRERSGSGILEGRVALVTGASSGIGSGIAAMLAMEGAGVVLAARREAELESVAADIRTRGGVAVAVPTDLVDDQSLSTLVERATSELGPVDVLVNSAGVALWKPLEHTSALE